MTRTWFENILNNLTYTNKKPPEFRDRFWEVRDMLDCCQQFRTELDQLHQ